ncbi:MAG: DNA repair protein RadA, partial [Caldiserica bacterium]|nr:DNA repair protein RadA [Caldisericota bacterium]
GVVPGSTILLGGEPGIGKSTLLLQAAHASGARVLYVSGEESNAQIALRARRLGIFSDKISLLSEINLENILRHSQEIKPEWLIIDSIQAVFHPEIDSSAGSVTQVRECAARLIQETKRSGNVLFLIGQVTKEGTIAGPRILEHMVDVVLYMEGEKRGFYRILRSNKNRFGSVNEVGVFEMTEKGFQEVRNPSLRFLSTREETSGSVVVPLMEGSRVILVEIQVLLTSSSFFPPRRVVNGMDTNRVILLLAVLEKRLSLPLFRYDLFLNVVGGIKVWETASDLGLAMAIISSIKNKRIPDTLIVGEVGLGGEVRPVSFLEKRIKEAESLGFKRFMVPHGGEKMKKPSKIEIIRVKDLNECRRILFGEKNIKKKG